MSKELKYVGGAAFPHTEVFTDGGTGQPFYENTKGMSLRDYFAVHAPMPDDSDIKREFDRDKFKNPYNEPQKPELRSRKEIECDLRYEHADAMLKAQRK